ncbi:MAG: helix-turn-helix domain-containing protein [Desulfovibrionaceae bacterium]|nr:helix-turn-helix domain-containing protein [Desulfovibrionaceae bacterium]
MRKLIKLLDLKDVEFARQTGVTKATISGYVKGVREPAASFVANLVRVFNVSSHWLLTGEGEMLLGSTPAATEPKQPEKTSFERDLAALTVYLDSMDASNETRKDALFRLFDDLRRETAAREHACAEPTPNNGYTVQEPHAPFNATNHKTTVKE